MRKSLLGIIALSALLAACGQTAGNTTNSSPALTSVTATAQGWTGGSGTLEVYSSNYPDLIKVASTPFSDKGTFTLTLPDKTTMQPLLDNLAEGFIPPENTTCTKTPTYSNGAAQIGSLDQMEITRNGVVIGYLSTAPFNTPTSSTLEAYGYFYSDRPVTIKGTHDCSYTSSSTSITYRNNHTFDLNFVAGWNIVNYKGSRVENTTTASYTSTTKTDFAWYAISAQ